MVRAVSESDLVVSAISSSRMCREGDYPVDHTTLDGYRVETVLRCLQGTALPFLGSSVGGIGKRMSQVTPLGANVMRASPPSESLRPRSMRSVPRPCLVGGLTV